MVICRPFYLPRVLTVVTLSLKRATSVEISRQCSVCVQTKTEGGHYWKKQWFLCHIFNTTSAVQTKNQISEHHLWIKKWSITSPNFEMCQWNLHCGHQIDITVKKILSVASVNSFTVVNSNTKGDLLPKGLNLLPPTLTAGWMDSEETSSLSLHLPSLRPAKW